MVEYLMYLVENLPVHYARFFLLFVDNLDVVDFFTYVMLLSGVSLIMYIINKPKRKVRV